MSVLGSIGDALKNLAAPPNYVILTPIIGGAPMRLLLGAAAPVPTADGGWAVVTRPKRSAFTAWEGYGPYQMTLNVMLDGLDPEVPQDKTFDDLHLIMRTPVGTAREPSPVKLSGPVPRTDLLWVINAIEQDPASIIRNSSGKLLRASVTLTLIQYVEADVLISLLKSPAATANAAASAALGAALGAGLGRPAGSGLGAALGAGLGSSAKTYTVKEGDTLFTIAQSQLGSYARFSEIGELNGIRDLATVPVGTVLRLP